MTVGALSAKIAGMTTHHAAMSRIWLVLTTALVLSFILLTSPPGSAQPASREGAGAAPPAAADAAQDLYVDPTTGQVTAPSVLRAFDKPAQNWLPGHRGVDLALSVGAEVLAAGAGTIAFAGPVAGTPVISIDHPDGIRTTYQPVHAQVVEGDSVAAGEVIGRLANPTDGWPGLHWGARMGKDYRNPLSLLAAPVIRLKPVDEPAGRPHSGAGR